MPGRGSNSCRANPRRAWGQRGIAIDGLQPGARRRLTFRLRSSGRARVCDQPTIAVSGVRNSCESVARNSSFVCWHARPRLRAVRRRWPEAASAPPLRGAAPKRPMQHGGPPEFRSCPARERPRPTSARARPNRRAVATLPAGPCHLGLSISAPCCGSRHGRAKGEGGGRNGRAAQHLAGILSGRRTVRRIVHITDPAVDVHVHYVRTKFRQRCAMAAFGSRRALSSAVQRAAKSPK